MAEKPDVEAPEQPDTEPVTATVITALLAAQAEFPTIARTHTAEVRGKDGKAGFKYTYADLADVLAAVKPILAKHGLLVSQHTRPTDNGKTRLATLLHHTGGDVLDSEVVIEVTTANPQQFGAALTYLRRYQIVTLLGIVAEEDRDAQDVVPPGTSSEPEARTLPEDAAERLAKIVTDAGKTDKQVATKLRAFGVKDLGELTVEQSLKVFEWAAGKES